MYLHLYVCLHTHNMFIMHHPHVSIDTYIHTNMIYVCIHAFKNFGKIKVFIELVF